MRVRFPWFDAFIRIVPVIDDWLSITNSTSSLIARQRFTCALWTHSSQRAHALARGVCRKNVQEHAHTMDMQNCTLGKKLLEWVQDSWKTVAAVPLKVAIPDSSLREGKGTLHCNWRLRCRMLSFWPVSLPRENRVLAATLCRKLFSHSLRFSEPTSNIHKLFAGAYRSLGWSFFSGWASLRDVLLRFHVPPLTHSVLHMAKPSCFALRVSLLSGHRRHQVRKGPWPRKGPKFANSLGTLDGHVPVWYWPCDQAKHLFITPRQHQWNRTMEWTLGGKMGDAKMYRCRKSYIYILCCCKYLLCWVCVLASASGYFSTNNCVKLVLQQLCQLGIFSWARIRAGISSLSCLSFLRASMWSKYVSTNFFGGVYKVSFFWKIISKNNCKKQLHEQVFLKLVGTFRWHASQFPKLPFFDLTSISDHMLTRSAGEADLNCIFLFCST